MHLYNYYTAVSTVFLSCRLVAMLFVQQQPQTIPTRPPLLPLLLLLHCCPFLILGKVTNAVTNNVLYDSYVLFPPSM